MESLRDLVRRRRDELGLTQEAFAEAVGMSQEWASNLETNRISTPHKRTLHKMADVLNLDIADLYLAAGMAGTRQKARDLADVKNAVSPLPICPAKGKDGFAPLPVAPHSHQGRSLVTDTGI